MSQKGSAVYENTNGMPMNNGKNLHMDVGKGDVASRIVTVGTVSRAEKIATFFDEGEKFRHSSSRGFTTITGTYKGVPVSAVAIGMGPSMMDFFVRETRAVTEGPLAMIRFGTCGGLSTEAPVGTCVVASQGSGYIMRNPDSFCSLYDNAGDAQDDPQTYFMSKVCPPNASLSTSLYSNLGEAMQLVNERHEGSCLDVQHGTNVTAESFYSSQGRIDPSFNDLNTDVIANVCKNYPGVKTMEMESFVLLHLAQCCTKEKPVYAAAAAIVVANRFSADVIDGSTLEDMEAFGGDAVLKTLCAFPLDQN